VLVLDGVLDLAASTLGMSQHLFVLRHVSCNGGILKSIVISHFYQHDGINVRACKTSIKSRRSSWIFHSVKWNIYGK
jgi:hypothetical protein